MVNEVKLFTGEILKLNNNEVWEIYDSEESTIGYPVDLIDIIINVDKFLVEQLYSKK